MTVTFSHGWTGTFSSAVPERDDVTEGNGTLADLRVIASYQFGSGAGTALFANPTELEVRRSRSGRPRQIIGPTGRLASLGQDGRLTLGYAGGRRLIDGLEPPAYRVRVGPESEPFVKDGDNAFAKFVHGVDPAVRPYDEVLVLTKDGETLLGVGRAELSATAMQDFDRGLAVSIREGRDEWADRSA